MKKTALTLLLALSGFNLFAQMETPEEMSTIKQTKGHGQCPVIYVTTSTGINNTTGVVGFSFDVPVAKYVSMDAGVGLSSWGNKLYLGGKYYLRPCHRGLAFSAAITHNTGVKEFQRDMETIKGVNEPVTLHLYAQTNILLAVYRYFNLGCEYNRFFVGAGWSTNISGKKWTETAGLPLSDDSRHSVDMMMPGGPMVTIGFSFGLYRD